MPCMCGDTQCPSCGPAQGNWRCPICRAWADDECEHLDENGVRPEFQDAANKAYEAQVASDEAYAEMMKHDDEWRW